VLVKSSRASWFEWLGGSTLLFWKWHDFVKEARDGFPICFLKKNLKKSKWKESKGTLPSDPALRRLFLEKINRLLDQRVKAIFVLS